MVPSGFGLAAISSFPASRCQCKCKQTSRAGSVDVAPSSRNQSEAGRVDYAGLDPISADGLLSYTNSRRQLSCCGLRYEDIKGHLGLKSHLRSSNDYDTSVCLSVGRGASRSQVAWICWHCGQQGNQSRGKARASPAKHCAGIVSGHPIRPPDHPPRVFSFQPRAGPALQAACG